MCVDQGVKTAQCGIAEIEAYGWGPSEWTRRGVIRDTPHIETVAPADLCELKVLLDSP